MFDSTGTGLRDVAAAIAVYKRALVEFAGNRIRVALNGKVYIELDDAHIKGAGAVGIWTKADSVTAFDDFRCAAQ